MRTEHTTRRNRDGLRSEYEAVKPLLKGGYTVIHQRGKPAKATNGRRTLTARTAAQLRQACGCPDSRELLAMARRDMASADQARITGQASIARARMQVAKSRMDRAKALQD